MRIHNSPAVAIAYASHGRNTHAASASMAKLSSGNRITRAADDASGLAIANRFRAELRSLKVASQNIEQALEMIDVAESAVNSIQEILYRLKELMVSAASKSSEPELPAILQEYGTMVAEIDRIATGTHYRGEKLLLGTYGRYIQVGPQNDPSQRILIDFACALPSFLNVSYAPPNPVDEIREIDNAIYEIGLSLSRMGRVHNRLEHAQSNVRTSLISLSASQGVIRDADMAEEVTRLTKHQTLQQASSYLLAQANQGSSGILSLFR